MFPLHPFIVAQHSLFVHRFLLLWQHFVPLLYFLGTVFIYLSTVKISRQVSMSRSWSPLILTQIHWESGPACPSPPSLPFSVHIFIWNNWHRSIQRVTIHPWTWSASPSPPSLTKKSGLMDGCGHRYVSPAQALIPEIIPCMPKKIGDEKIFQILQNKATRQASPCRKSTSVSRMSRHGGTVGGTPLPTNLNPGFLAKIVTEKKCFTSNWKVSYNHVFLMSA